MGLETEGRLLWVSAGAQAPEVREKGPLKCCFDSSERTSSRKKSEATVRGKRTAEAHSGWLTSNVQRMKGLRAEMSKSGFKVKVT